MWGEGPGSVLGLATARLLAAAAAAAAMDKI